MDKRAYKRKLRRFAVAVLAGHTREATFAGCGHTVRLLHVDGLPNGDALLKTYVGRAAGQLVRQYRGKTWRWENRDYCPHCWETHSNCPEYYSLWRDACVKISKS